ncbi:MAG: PD40 domain-containing protein, partial [Planctomycetes bacterium]|nr:PD40 domain-containing protein [Planctomycetota bacterium]
RTLYFASNRKAAERMGKRIQWRATIRQGQLGDYDLFSTDVDFAEALPTTETSQPTTVPSARLKIHAEQALELQGVNTEHNEGTPCVSPWGDFLYFASNRPGGQGGFDLYRARITEGRCQRLENLGAEVNTAGNETDPQLTKGGFMLYFSSDRDGGEEGTYDLYTSESHEVYASRVGRGLPTLGWSVWVLLASLVLLIPLMLFLRAGGYKHLSMLQKCFVVALLLHLLLTLMLSLAQVSQEIYQYVVDEPDEVELDLIADKQLEVRTQVRHQLADLAPAAPSQTQIARLNTEFQPVQEEVKRIDTDVPEARRRPVEYISEPDKPKDEPKIKPEQVATPTPTVHMSELAIKLTPPEVKIRSDEAKPQTATTPPSPNQVRQPTAVVKTTRPDSTRLPTETTKSVPDTLAHAAEVSRPVGDAQRQEYTPAPKLTEMSIALAAPKRSSNPIKEAPSSSATTVKVVEPTGAERKQAAASAAKAGSARIKTPTVQADSDSLMAKSGPTRAERPLGDAVAHADIPTLKVVGVAMNLSGPKINPSKIKAAQEPTDTASADKPVGSSRAAASKPTSTAGSAKLAVPSVKPSGKSLAMTGSTAEIAKPLGKVSPQVALPAPVVVAVVVSPSSPKIKAAAKQVEARPQTASTPPSANQARQRSAIVKTTRPDSTRLPTETTKSVSDTLAHVAEVSRPLGDAQRRDHIPAPKLTEMSIALAAPKRSSNPIKEAPSAGATTVKVAEPTGAERKQIAASAARAGSARIKTPTVQADSDSLLAESGPTRAERPLGDAVAQADTPTPKVVDVAMNLSGPKIKPSKVKAAQEPTDTASADKPAGSSRAAASKPTSTAGSAKLAVPSVEPSGKSLAMTGSTAEIARPLGKVSPQVALPAPAIADVVISPASPKIKSAAKQTEASPASSAVASLKSVRTGPVRSTAPSSKAGTSRLSAPTARLSQHSLASAITVTHQVAKASEVSVSVNVPLPGDAPKVGLPTPPASVAAVGAESVPGQIAKEVTTAGVGKIAAAPKAPSGSP